MPWMLAYQQSALCEKGLNDNHGASHLLIERIDTALGSLLTQGVMAAMLITVAACPLYTNQDSTNVGQLVDIVAYVMGSRTAAKVALTFAVCGACMVAAIVVTMCGSWALEEAMGLDRQRRETVAGSNIVQRAMANVSDRPVFFMVYIGTCTVSWIISVAAPDFANYLTGVTTQFINGLLMPPIVFALWYLASYKLPDQYRIGGGYKWLLFVVFGVCSAFCLASIPFAVIDALNGS